MAKYRSDGQVVSVTDCRVNGSLVKPDCRFSVHWKEIALLAFYDAITGPTESIISLVKSVKMVDML